MWYYFFKEEQSMDCAKSGCKGRLLEFPVSLMFICPESGNDFIEAFPCATCGRLHWGDGSLVCNKSGDEIALVKGKIVLRS